MQPGAPGTRGIGAANHINASEASHEAWDRANVYNIPPGRTFLSGEVSNPAPLSASSASNASSISNNANAGYPSKLSDVSSTNRSYVYNPPSPNGPGPNGYGPSSEDWSKTMIRWAMIVSVVAFAAATIYWHQKLHIYLYSSLTN